MLTQGKDRCLELSFRFNSVITLLAGVKSKDCVIDLSIELTTTVTIYWLFP